MVSGRTPDSRSSSSRLRSSPPPYPVKRAVGPDHAVAGHDHRDRVAAVGKADGASGAGGADLAGDLAVADGLAVGDLAQRLPDAQLERVAGEAERERRTRCGGRRSTRPAASGRRRTRRRAAPRPGRSASAAGRPASTGGAAARRRRRATARRSGCQSLCRSGSSCQLKRLGARRGRENVARLEPHRLGEQLVGMTARLVVVGDRHRDHLLGAVLPPQAPRRRRATFSGEPTIARRPGTALSTVLPSRARNSSAFSGGGTAISSPAPKQHHRHPAARREPLCLLGRVGAQDPRGDRGPR